VGPAPSILTDVLSIDDPGLRNLHITQTYHDLSLRMRALLNSHDATWCTFGSWASKTAGSFITGSALPEMVQARVRRSRRVQRQAQRIQVAVRQPTREAGLALTWPLDVVLDTAADVAGDVALYIGEGNRVVFAEMGEACLRFIASIGRYGPTDEALDDMLGHLEPGPPEPDAVTVDWPTRTVTSAPKGGQGLLRQMLEHYFLALTEPDRHRKAQLILLGNALGGVHEQTRLQTYVIKALNAPIDDLARTALHHHVGPAEHPGAADGLGAIINRLAHPLADAVKLEWRAFATTALMTMELPDGPLDLSRDIKPARGRPMYPGDLATIDLVPLEQLLQQYGALSRLARRHGASAAVLRLVIALTERVYGEVLVGDSVAAGDWGRLAHRMRFILTLFRSHQQDRRLFDPPLAPADRAKLIDGRPSEERR
jgi:hypothetical protein